MSGYEYQAIDHDASIRAERPDPNGFVDQVKVTITHGEDEPTSITMWAEDFETMAREVLPHAQIATHAPAEQPRGDSAGRGVSGDDSGSYTPAQHYADGVIHLDEPVSWEIGTATPAEHAQGVIGQKVMTGVAAQDWTKVEHTADQCQFETCSACGCCAHGKEHVIGCSTTLDEPLGAECPNPDCGCKGAVG